MIAAKSQESEICLVEGRKLYEMANQNQTYRKILKISPGAYIFQRPFLRSLFLEGLICGWKFAFLNRLG